MLLFDCHVCYPTCCLSGLPLPIECFCPTLNQVLGAGLVAIHTWPPMLALMRRLLPVCSPKPPVGRSGTGLVQREIPSGTSALPPSAEAAVGTRNLTRSGYTAGSTVVGSGSGLLLRSADLPSMASSAAAGATEAARTSAEEAEEWRRAEEARREALWSSSPLLSANGIQVSPEYAPGDSPGWTLELSSSSFSGISSLH